MSKYETAVENRKRPVQENHNNVDGNLTEKLVCWNEPTGLYLN